jgi:hypothetical protein
MGWPMSIGAKYCGVGYADHGCCQVEYCAMVGHPINQPQSWCGEGCGCVKLLVKVKVKIGEIPPDCLPTT